MVVDSVECFHILVPIAMQSCRNFIPRCHQMHFHHAAQRCLRPIGIGFTQERGNVFRITIPFPIDFLKFRLIPALGCVDEIDCDRDSFFHSFRMSSLSDCAAVLSAAVAVWNIPANSTVKTRLRTFIKTPQFSFKSEMLLAVISRPDALENLLDKTITAGAQELESLTGCRPGPFKQLPANGCAGTKEANLHVLFADAQGFRGFPSAHSFDVPQHEDSTMLVRQRIDGVLQ